MVAGNARLLNVVFTKVCSRISKRSASVCGTSGGTGDALPVKERWPGELDNIAMSPSNAYWGTGESSSRFAIKCRATPFFCRSALTRRRKGMLSCGRKSFKTSTNLDFPSDTDATGSRPTYLVQAPMVLQPLVLKQLLRARSHRWVLVKTFLEKRDERTGKAFRNWRALVFDYPEHHCAFLSF